MRFPQPSGCSELTEEPQMLLLVSHDQTLPCPSLSWWNTRLVPAHTGSSALSPAPCFAPALVRLTPKETAGSGEI